MKKSFDEIYENVPQNQKECLKEFRSTHPYCSLRVDGITWEYLSCGKGKETLVLLPGGFRFAETWFKLITVLENEYRIVSPTYPAVSTMEHLARGVSAILTSEKIEKAHILGTSFGGWLAQCFLFYYPDRVKTLILSNTSGREGFSKYSLLVALAIVPLYPEWLLRLGIKKRYLSLLSVPASERQFWKAYTEEVALKTTKNDIISQQKCTIDFVSHTFSKDDLATWPGEILILESDNDQAFNPSTREALRSSYPTAQVHTFRNAGHTPGYTNPTEYSAVVRNFLRLNAE